jgi:hypothetical protein
LKINARQRELLNRTKALIDHIGKPLIARDIADEFNIPVQAIDAVLRIGQREGEIERGGEDFWLTDGLIAKWRKKAQRSGGKGMTRKEFRDLFGLSRSVADAVYALILVGDEEPQDG